MRTLALAISLLIPTFTINSPEQGTRFPENVSMVQLIATPEKFDGKMVAVIGFLRLEFEGNELYLHEDDYKNAISKNGIWVGTREVKWDADKLNMHYVLLVGTFNASNKGHMSAASASISAIGASIWPRTHDQPSE